MITLPRRDPKDRFAQFVNMEGECWEWTGYKNRGGYGQFGEGGRYGRVVGAHRFAWEAAYGPIPPGMHVLHKCNNPSCVRQEHLYLGNDRANQIDTIRAGRSTAIFTENEVRGIKGALLLTKLTHTQIARLFKCARTTISNIHHGYKWSWIKVTANGRTI